jgi:hypothetical protein
MEKNPIECRKIQFYGEKSKYMDKNPITFKNNLREMIFLLKPN